MDFRVMVETESMHAPAAIISDDDGLAYLGNRHRSCLDRVRGTRWTLKRAVSSMFVLTGLALAACGDDGVSLPQPQPIPGLVRRSTPAMTAADPQTLVVGLAGAVEGVGELELRRVSDGLAVTATSASKGSFALVIAAVQGDALELRFRGAHGTSEPLTLAPTLTTRGPFLGPPQNTFGEPVSPPDGSGNVIVTNDSDEPDPYFAASPDSEVLVSNESNGAVAADTTDGAGLFGVTLPGNHGDTIHVLLAASGDIGATSDFLTFTVP